MKSVVEKDILYISLEAVHFGSALVLKSNKKSRTHKIKNNSNEGEVTQKTVLALRAI